MGQVKAGSRRGIAILCVLVLAIILGAPTMTAAHHPGQLDQQFTLSQASTQQQIAQLNTNFGSDMSVLVCTVFSNPCQARSGVNVTFTAEPASGGASGTFTNASNTVTVTSGANGIATAPTFAANGTVGSYAVRVVADEPTPEHAVPTFYFFTNSSGDPATKVAIVSDGVGRQLTTQIDTTFSPNLSLVTLNGSGGYAVGVSVVFSAPTTGASGTFTNGTTAHVGTTGPTGLVEAPAFQANSGVGEYFVTATVSGAQTTTGQPMSVSFAMRNSGTSAVGVPVLISAAAGNGQQVGVLSPYPTDLQIVVLDGAGAYVDGASVTFTTPATGPSATFAGGALTFSTSTGSTGLATAGQLTSNSIAGQFSVGVSVTKNDVTLTSAMALINGRVMTTTTLTKDPTGSSVYGQPVVLSATVRPVVGTYVPTGPVTFSQAGTAITACSSVTPSGGVATCTLSGLTAAESSWLTVGSDSYSASYFGDAISQPSASATVTHRVDKADTTITLVSSEPELVLEGGSVTFTATVNVTAPGRGDPVGSMTFTSSDGTTLTGSSLVNGTATVTTSALEVGRPQITATYSGGTSFNGSNTSITQNVYTVPEVTTDPVSHQVLVGETAAFTAAATGFPDPTAQWQVSSDGGATFTDIQGATAPTYRFTAVREDDQKQYRAVFTNAAGADTSAAATLTVREPLLFTSEPETTFTVGEAGLYAIEVDGHVPLTISQTGGTLPAGVTFDAVSGVLSGTPVDGTGGVYELEFTAANGMQPDPVQTFTLTVNEAPELTSDAATTFILDEPGSFTVTASGYPAPTFSTSDPLPAGVTLAAGGLLSGTPTDAGTFPLTIRASNGVGTDATQTLALTIEQATQATLVLTATPAEGVTGDRLALDVTGGSGTGEVSYDVGQSTACEIGTGTDAGMLVVIHGVGTCAVTATKASDTAYLAVTSNSVTVTVSRATTVLVVDDATGTFDGHATFTATLTTGGNPLAGKDVRFTGPGGVDLGSASTDESGVATMANVSLGGIAAGTYDLAASVARDDDYLESADDAALTIDKAAGAVRISNLPASAGVGNNVVLAFAPLGDGTPSATSLTSDACTVDVNGIVTFLLEGECQLQASVTAGTNHEAATGDVQVVTVTAPARKTTTTTLTSSANPATVGQEVTLTARVAPDVRNGTVTFLVDGRSIGTVAIGRRGTATIAMPTASAGTFNVRAVYDGTTTHAGSQSAPVVQNVQASTVTRTTTSLSSSANPVLAAQHVTFTAVVNPPTATGTVTFTAGRRVLGTAPVTGGQATLTTTLTKGTYGVVATYGGDATHAASTSQTLTQVVDRVR